MNKGWLFLLIFIHGAFFSQLIHADTIVRDTSYTVYSSYIKVKKNYPNVEIVQPQFDGLKVKEGIVYKEINDKRNLVLNIYRPDDNNKYPVVLMIHGGGWNSGKLSMQIPLAAKLAQQGFVCIPVEYRLSPEALYSAAVQDLEDAVEWIYKYASEYGIDKEKIIVSGCSAGGQLACLIGTRNKNNLIKGVINVDGISTFLEPATIERAEKARKNNTKIPVDALWLGGTYSEQPQNWKGASALLQVWEKSAPVCFINSSIPRFHNGRDELRQELSNYNIYSEVHEIENTPHTFWLFYPWFDITVKYMVDFLNRYKN